MTSEVTQADEYLIRKNGYWYRPNANGYTSSQAEAGRYTLEEAIRHSHPNGPNGPRDGITYEPAPPRLTTQSGEGRSGAIEAYLIERLEGEGYGPPRRIVDGRIHDPTSDAYWVNMGIKKRHRVTPLAAFTAQSGEGEDAAEVASELSARDRRTLTDTQRLIWRDDVEGICPTPDMCFEYGDHVRCGPCAIKQAAAHGVASDMSLPSLPEVARLRREASDLRRRVEALAVDLDAYVLVMTNNPDLAIDVGNRVRAALNARQSGEGERGQ